MQGDFIRGDLSDRLSVSIASKLSLSQEKATHSCQWPWSQSLTES